MRERPNVDELIDRQRRGFCLEQPFYVDEDIFARDLERFIFRHWLAVGHESRIPGPGDYFVVDIAGESLIICRDGTGRVHAHFNVCRHRGSRLCLETEGTTGRIICPYHAWAYELDGRLFSAQTMPSDFDPADYGLSSCATEVVEGVILVTVGATPLNLDSLRRELEPFLRPLALSRTKVATRRSYPIEANWKLVLENVVECYHCGPAHREYCRVHESAVALSTASPRRASLYQKRVDAWAERVGQLGLPAGEVRSGQWADMQGDGESRDEGFFAYRLPLREGYKTQSDDGEPVALLLGGFPAYDGGETVVGFGPLSFVLAASDYAVLFRVVPIDVRRTNVELTWLVHSDAVEGQDYDVDRLTWLWDVTTQQDKWIIENNQAGVDSRAYRPGPYATCEDDTIRFISRYLRELA